MYEREWEQNFFTTTGQRPFAASAQMRSHAEEEDEMQFFENSTVSLYCQSLICASRKRRMAGKSTKNIQNRQKCSESFCKKSAKTQIALDTKKTYATAIMDKNLNKRNVYSRHRRTVGEKQRLQGMNIPDGKLAFSVEENQRKVEKVSSNLTKL